ncbi:MAG: methyltransferase domain-containing protein [Candidatus Hydrogenedentes bacterium]|nr:methyltransferase domain-containing protein [Candidatus Hydrogenedentota bacterium]
MTGQSAEFVERTHCINCGSTHLTDIASGRIGDNPLRSFLESDPWGESPMPYIENAEWAYARCEDCQQTFHRRILAPAWVQKHYTDWVSHEAMQQFSADQNTPEGQFQRARENAMHVLRIEKLTRGIRGGDAVRVLDFGCGYGDFLAVCDCFGFEASGIDFSPDRRREGRVEILPDMVALKATARAEKGFHAATLFQVLEHVTEPLNILKSVGELVLPGGLLVLETPDCTGVTGIQTLSDYRNIHPLDHINGFVPATLCSIAQRAGFDPIDRGEAHVTADWKRAAKTEVKRLIGRFRKPTTQQYFRKR